MFLKGQGHYIKENNALVTLAAAKWLKGGGENTLGTIGMCTAQESKLMDDI
ncbi:hypothetical protein B4143_0543 [Bacillus subtilis]|nr:hypothetical protein B4143_0543 [Bacillus subtilis]